MVNTFFTILLDILRDTINIMWYEGRTFADVAEAYEQALSEAESDDFIFVGGSSYIVADFLSQF